MKTCSVDWCACLPVEGSTYCVAHRMNPSLKPAELAADEELVPGAVSEKCDECNGSGECDCCNGSGEGRYECRNCCDTHHAACHSCDGSGECGKCEGRGTLEVRKKQEAA